MKERLKAAVDIILTHGEVRDWSLTQLKTNIRSVARAMLDDAQNPSNESIAEAKLATKLLAMGWHKKLPSVVIVDRIQTTVERRPLMQKSQISDTIQKVLTQ